MKWAVHPLWGERHEQKAFLWGNVFRVASATLSVFFFSGDRGRIRIFAHTSFVEIIYVSPPPPPPVDSTHLATVTTVFWVSER